MSYTPQYAWQPPPPQPPPPLAPKADPLAVAVGNASLLGVGYVLMKRWVLAIVNLMVVGALLIFLLVLKQTWCEIALAVWWVLVVVHGWFLAHRAPQKESDLTKRLVALGITIPVLLAIGLVRYDASRIAGKVSDAREAGDCSKLTAAQEELWLGHRIVDAPGTEKGDAEVQLCGRLDDAKAVLATGLTGDNTALEDGFDTLGSVLAEPGHDKTVDVTLKGWLDDLPLEDPCRTVRVTDWLRQREATNNVLDQSKATVTKTAPAAILGCADRLMGQKSWDAARTSYQQLVTQYPKDSGVAKAQAGIRQATLAIELTNVRNLLATNSYCSNPARYSGARPYAGGFNPGMFEGDDEYTKRLPASWRASDASNAVVIVCAEDAVDGTSLRTCPYRSEKNPQNISDVTFHKVAVPVKVYELRTGRIVSNTRVQIDGPDCPARITYSTYLTAFDYPPSSLQVIPSDANVQAAFRYLFLR
ncbi:hypothetical protein [Kribbella lupini]|uniref:Tetratricopeptide repeat protein n=1 Tax=Kribbella lupini TaxID=291602 RepID=A0ABP4M3P2_9ACTN